MSRYAKVDIVAEVITLAQRDEVLKQVSAELKETPPSVEYSPYYCTCGHRGDEYDPCTCFPAWRRNPEYEKLERQVEELKQMRFCECGRRTDPSFIYCPSCSKELLPRITQ